MGGGGGVFSPELHKEKKHSIFTDFMFCEVIRKWERAGQICRAIYTFPNLRVFRFSQSCCYRFKSSGMLRRDDW
jgi:hypothetical protein